MGLFKKKTDFDYRTFTKMRRKWKKLKIVDYCFSYRVKDVDHQMAIINVKGGDLIRVIGEIPDRTDKDAPNKYTIDGIFNEIETLYSKPYLEKKNRRTYIKCIKIEVKYDPNYFFPTEYTYHLETKNMKVPNNPKVQFATNLKKV